MTKIFNNTNKKDFPSENLTISGWDKTADYDAARISHITDTVGAGIALTKMGTSIPTPFARIFLFKTAFEMVNGSTDLHNDQSAYGKLVSECLDFLEFIYDNGDNITVKAWNVNSNIDALKNSPSEGHQKLGKSLENFALDLGVTDIYLIYFNDKLIGGTSPFTLVYTSPNWQRHNPIAGAHGLAGNELFPDYSNPNVVATPLHKRDPQFQIMLTRYYVAFHNVPAISNSAFFKYIYDNQNSYYNEGAKEAQEEYKKDTGLDPYTVGKFFNDYPRLQEDGADIDIVGKGGKDALFIATKYSSDPIIQGPTIPDEHVNDDYKIVPTVNRYGLDVQPLALTEAGISSALYVSDNPFPKTSIDRDLSIPLGERILPGGQHIKYPYLTDADFFQEKIIKVPYKVDTDNFMTFGVTVNGMNDYLLPLRKEIFNFFSPEDFGKVKNLSLTITEKDEQTVEACLRVPVMCKSHPFIELKHTYEKEDIVQLMTRPESFSVAVFPSYKILGNAVPNIYSVLVGDDDDNQISTSYYRIDNDAITEVPIERSHKRQTNGSRYEEIGEAFDICELHSHEGTALLLPKFKQVTPSDRGGSTVVGIDFGTTNTYICYSTENGGNPHSLDITKNDMQVLTLNKIDLSKGNYGTAYIDSMYAIQHIMQALDREYVPLLLGKESNVAFPFRTVTCETGEFTNAVGQPQLFAEINVGFNFFNELVKLTNEEKYNTDIKWELEEGKGNDTIPVKQNRVKAFTLELAWMVKSKIMLLDNSSTKFTVFLTFPHTMSKMIRNDFEDFWRDAFDKVMGAGNVQIETMTESIAPYYSLISNDGNYSENALNIDIGGGTTDMLFADVENKTFYYDSSKFAGNDIWGDGLHLIEKHDKDNGFVTYFENKLSHSMKVSDERRDGYEKYKETVKKSSDLMSYVFRYDDEFNYTSFIRESKDKFLPILCVHIAAIMYHVAQVLVEKKITVPTTITFSGMGAKYIQIISNRERDIKDIVWNLLSAFLKSITGTEYKQPQDFTVKFQKNAKEVTAQGAMLFNHPSLNDIKGYDKESLCVYGFEGAPKEMEYKDTPSVKDKVLDAYNHFLDAFFGNKELIRFFQNDFSIRINESLADVLKHKAGDSFDNMTKSTKDEDDIVNETMLFWPLKGRIYEATKEAAKASISTKN